MDQLYSREPVVPPQRDPDNGCRRALAGRELVQASPRLRTERRLAHPAGVGGEPLSFSWRPRRAWSGCARPSPRHQIYRVVRARESYRRLVHVRALSRTAAGFGYRCFRWRNDRRPRQRAHAQVHRVVRQRCRRRVPARCIPDRFQCRTTRGLASQRCAAVPSAAQGRKKLSAGPNRSHGWYGRAELGLVRDENGCWRHGRAVWGGVLRQRAVRTLCLR